MTPLALEAGRVLAEPWRLWTAHLIHWDALHAAANLAACAVPLGWMDRRTRRRIGVDLLGLLPLLSLLLLPALHAAPYRGASGLACLLWAAAGITAPYPREGLALLALLAAKLVLEKAAGPLVPGAEWRALPSAHLWGAGLGLAWGLHWKARSAPCLPSSSPAEPSPTA